MMYDKYFEFLRYSLVKDYPIPVNIHSIDWQGLYEFGCRQSLLGVLFAGIRKLPADVAPPQKLLVQWFAMSDKIRRQNIRVSNAAVELFRQFTSDGFRCCLLKGQGNALFYPDPYTRSSGDVDMWICGYADAAADCGYSYPSAENMRHRIFTYLKERFKINNIRTHHVCFLYKDVEIEAHSTGASITHPIYGKRFQKWCQDNARKQSEYLVELPDTDRARIAIPTVSFNIIFQMNHIYRHFLDIGIGMRQLTDYYLLLMKYDGNVEKTDELRRDLRYLGLWKIAGAVMWVLGETFQIPGEKMIVPPDERRGKLLLAEILNGGNFGKYDTKYGNITRMSIGKKYFAKTFRNLSFVRYYPTDVLLEPLCRTYYFFWRKLRYRM